MAADEAEGDDAGFSDHGLQQEDRRNQHEHGREDHRSQRGAGDFELRAAAIAVKGLTEQARLRPIADGAASHEAIMACVSKCMSFALAMLAVHAAPRLGGADRTLAGAAL